ncbi:histidine kinase [Actinocorallia sp. B10E7]|uniref:sensor histidine kinase n=1 Tax=Actinocorallia sp. B10E7 TaxID=3153558 RepID=UPI00325C8058
MILFEVVAARCAGFLEHNALSSDVMLQVVVVANRVISERIRLAASSYTGFLLDTVQQAHVGERRRIGRELHDRVGGDVAAALRMLERAETARPEPVEGVEQACEVLRDTLRDLRDLIHGLRLEEPRQSLERALLDVIDNSDAAGMTYLVKVNGDDSLLPAQVRSEVFLIIREALRNIFAHSLARVLRAQIDIAPGEIRATVEDNGIGIGTDPDPRSSGLSSMRERAALLGGSLAVVDRFGGGTRVELAVPLFPADRPPDLVAD